MLYSRSSPRRKWTQRVVGVADCVSRPCVRRAPLEYRLVLLLVFAVGVAMVLANFMMLAAPGPVEQVRRISPRRAIADVAAADSPALHAQRVRDSLMHHRDETQDPARAGREAIAQTEPSHTLPIAPPSPQRPNGFLDPANGECAKKFNHGYSDVVDVCPTRGGGSIQCAYNAAIRAAFCRARHAVLDPSAIVVSQGGERIAEVLGRKEGKEFPVYAKGAWRVACDGGGIARDRKRLMPHFMEELLIDGGRYNVNAHKSCAPDTAGPTLLVTRYEYANMYHTMTDWYNVYSVARIHGIDFEAHAPTVILLDGHPQGALDNAWTTLFGSRVSLVSQLPAEPLCLADAVIVPPGYRSALSVGTMHEQRRQCMNEAGLVEFRDFVLRRFGLKSEDADALPARPPSAAKLHTNSGGDVNAPIQVTEAAAALPQQDTIFGTGKVARVVPPQLTRVAKDAPLAVTLILRRGYLAHPRQRSTAASRMISNEAELVRALGQLPGVDVRYYDFAALNVASQIAAIRASDVVIGMHGAALSLVLFLRPSAHVIELAPADFASRVHFRYFAQYAGVSYESLRVNGGGGGSVLNVKVAPIVQAVKKLLPTSGVPDAPPPVETPEAPRDDGGEDKARRMCIVIPFRDSASNTSQGGNRTANLMEFVPYMTKWLRDTSGRELGVDYSIIVVEMMPGPIFNKGALFNVGYKLSEADHCAYMVLHDVDQLPEDPENDYAYPGVAPVHLCSKSSQYNYKKLYPTMVGGALAITLEHFRKVNGYSNFYWGWGQEDDDFYYRMANSRVRAATLDKGRYRALAHPRVQDLDVTPVFNKGTKHLRDTMKRVFDIQTEGLAQVKYEIKGTVVMQPGVVRYQTELQFDDMPTSLQG